MLKSIDEAVREVAARRRGAHHARFVASSEPFTLDHHDIREIGRLTGMKVRLRPGQSFGRVATVQEAISAIEPFAVVSRPGGGL